MSKISEVLEDSFFDAFNIGREDEALFQGMEYGVWSAILDAGTCDYCRFADGKTFRLTEEHPVPPVHFGDRCVIVYFTAEMLEEDGLEVYEEFDPWENPPSSMFPPGSKKGK